MEKSFIIIASALCFLSFAGSSYSEDQPFTVQGSVYCDTCRVEFVTKLSKNMPGAQVRLECVDREDSSNIKFKAETVTDDQGNYKIEVNGDHEDEVCEVTLVKSADPDCDEQDNGKFHEHSSRVSLTRESGISDLVRNANPIGFLKKQPLLECGDVLKELGLTSHGELVRAE